MFAVLMLVAVYLFTKVPIKYFEKASNYYGIVDKNEYRLDEGMPYIGNIAMGTRIKHFDYYGWYDGTNSYVYITQCNFDTEKATIEYKKIIDESLRYACKNPDIAVDFLLKKTESIWMDPIFDVLYFTGFNRTNDSALSNYLYYGSGKDLFKYFSDVYQSTVYVFCLLSIAYKLKNVKKTKIETLIVPIITLGGFLFLLFWEASARYTLPYFFMSIMCAADGLYCAYNFLLKKRNRNIKA